eukprot:scaffold9957_cov195-Skeletonema_dohrnii-CCMP3373.AAC.2
MAVVESPSPNGSLTSSIVVSLSAVAVEFIVNHQQLHQQYPLLLLLLPPPPPMLLLLMTMMMNVL